ncbi:ribonuclease J [Catenisphaera adipataccumulans]|uniref:Ribonuclease J n=1 Tax=Catenisphaera adipataccumulans TaxID=700500 RepID=A0A7W8D0S3_9FIRM|nr:ribonuclease J [Catenisphaera adipataccumulans]MBB5183889.1 ribonuclease J [Catenisphaera adipataccumulans]
MEAKSNHNQKQPDEKVRIFALGGQDEDGKTMLCVEIDEQIYLIEAGMKYPDENESLGIEFIIPDFSYLIENKDRIAAIFITHGHDDVMTALPYLLKQVHTQVYTSPLAAKEIQKRLRKEHITGSRIHVVKRNDQKRIGKRRVIFLPITHAYPGAFGVAIQTSQGYVVYSGEFIEDYDDMEDSYRGDFSTCSRLRKEGVLALLQESKGADRSGHTSPMHRITPTFNRILDQHEAQRIFISVYTQSVYRVQEIIDCCLAHNRKMVFYNKDMWELLKNLKTIGYEVPEECVMDISDYKPEMKNVVIIISGQGPSLFRMLNNIANNEVDDIEFHPDDVICLASQVIHGVEQYFKTMENDIYKANGHLYVVDALSMHPSREDLKMMLFLTRPKYYIPVRGQYRLLHMNAQVAVNMGYSASNILILDNGQVATFEKGKLRSCSMEFQLKDTLIDGKENWDMAGAVLKDREILSTDGVVILAIGIDAKTKKIINGPDVQTRGLIYLRDAEYISGDLGKIMIDVIEDDVKHKVYENVETREKIRSRVKDYLIHHTAKRPMILPVIMEIRK